MDINQLQTIIRNGENSKIEFKGGDFHPDSLAKEIVSFSNLSGGMILIGIDDSGNIEGITDRQTEERVINICRNNVVPSVIPEIETIVTEDKKILVIVIEKGKFKPYKVRASNKFYIRAGTVSAEPTNEELIRLFQDGEQLHFEVFSIPGTSEDMFDYDRFNHYCTKFRRLEPEDRQSSLPYNLQLMDKQKQLTVAGALFFGKEVSRYLPQSGLELRFFKGEDTTSEIVDFKTVSGSIPDLIEASLNFVRNNSSVRVEFSCDETHRTDFPDYEPFFIRELTANAFMHRDWSIFGQKIRLNLFNDRLEIFSPGKIPNTMSIENALSGISYYRNPVISQLLTDYGFSEKIGRGLAKIVRHCREKKYSLPLFDLSDHYFRVILSNLNS